MPTALSPQPRQHYIKAKCGRHDDIGGSFTSTCKFFKFGLFLGLYVLPEKTGFFLRTFGLIPINKRIFETVFSLSPTNIRSCFPRLTNFQVWFLYRQPLLLRISAPILIYLSLQI